MSRVTLCWPNRIDESTVTSSGATWTSTLPLANVKDRVIQKPARTTAATSVTLKVLLPKSRLLGVVALVNHNLSLTATVQVKGYKGVDNTTTLLFDSGTANKAWPVVVSPKMLAWEDPNFWTGTIEEEQRESYTKLFTYFAPANKSGRYVEIIITDTNNSNGYIQIGRVFVGQWIEPEFNPDYNDISQGYIDTTEVQVVPGTGTEYFDEQAKFRTVSLAWKDLSLADAYLGVYDAYRSQGISKEVLFAYTKKYQDPSFYARAFLGRFTSTDPIGQPYLNAYSAQINIKEIK